jgi:hypothetical protein
MTKTKTPKLSQPAAFKTRPGERGTHEADPQTTAVFGEVDTVDDLGPALHALLLALPHGTRVYVRLKQTVH